MAWRASPPALGIAYCTRLPWAPPARWGFPALSGSLALNLGSLPNAGRMSDEVCALVCPFPMMASPGLATMNESSHSQGTPAYLGSLIPPLFPPLSLSEMTRALRAKVRSSGRGDWRCVLVSCLSMDAQQFRYPSLAPRVERGLPWSLPRPFCLASGLKRASFYAFHWRGGDEVSSTSKPPLKGGKCVRP